MASMRTEVVRRMESTHTTSASGAAAAKTSSLRLRLQKTISTCEFSLEVKYEDAEEYYENLSFNPNEPNFVGKKLEKSDLVSVQYTGAPTEEPIPPFAQLAGTEQPVVSISLANGSDGSVASLSPADFIGTDNGAGQRTGIQAFLDRESSCCISPVTPEMA